MKLRRQERTDRPGLVRTARIDRRVGDLVPRLHPGDIAVIDVIDLDRRTAEALVAAGVSAVVNAAPSCSGRFPVRGPQALLEAGVLLVDEVGGEVFSRVRDGDTVRLDGAAVYAAGEQVVEGHLQSDETVAEANALAHDGLEARVAALVADAGRRLGADARLLDGDSFPPLRTDFRDAVVVVVAATATVRELRAARRVVRGKRSVIVGVGAGADAAAHAGLRPDLVVVGPGARAGTSALAHAREVLVLDAADLDVPVPTGVVRAHAAGLGSAEDTAVMLAHARAAALVLTCGIDDSLAGVLDRSTGGGSMPLLAAMRGGGRHLAATTLPALRPGRARSLSGLAIALIVAALLVGLVLGAGPVASHRRASSSAAAAATAASQLAAARRAAAAATGFDAAVAPGLVDGRLSGHVVTVVALPGATLSSAMSSTLAASGAAVNSPITLDAGYLDPTRTPVLRDLVAQLEPSTQASAPSGPAASSASASSSGSASGSPAGSATAATDPAAQLDGVLAGALLTGGTGSGTGSGTVLGATDPSTATIINGLDRLGGLTAPATMPKTADLLVLLVPAHSDAAVSARAAALARAFGARGRGVVVVSTGSGSTSSTGTVRALRTVATTSGTNSADSTVSTVDDGGRVQGRVAAVLALAARIAKRPAGAYGWASDASAAIPTR